MPVGDEHLGHGAGDRLELGRRTVEGIEGGEVIHVPDVRREPGIATVRDAEGVLEVAAGRQRRCYRDRQRDRQRSESARAANRQFCSSGYAQYRVVAGHVDRAVVLQPRVGEAREPDERLLVIGHQRLAGQIAAGHHEHARRRWIARQPEQQVMQRRVRKHHAEVGAVRGDLIGKHDGRSTPARQQYDRAAHVEQQRTFGAPTSASSAATSTSATMTANGLSPRSLRLRKVATESRSVASQAR